VVSAPGQAARRGQDGVDARDLCAAIESLVEALHPHLRGRVKVAMDTTLDRDLGLDSLSRIELLTRIERKFGVSLSERDMAAAETPRDILRALQSAAPSAPRFAEGEALPTADFASIEAPEGAKTLVDVLLRHAQSQPERTHVHLFDDETGTRALSYGELLTESRAVAAGLRAHGHQPGEAVAIMLPTCAGYFFSFFGILLAGGIPVPIYPPARISQIEDHFRRHAGILANAGVTMLITFEQAKQVTRLLVSQVERLSNIATVEELCGFGRLEETGGLGADAVAFIQYTSGSTGNPKGVVLTHGNLLSSLDSMAQALEASASDVFVSWLPLYHDMGLIGAWMGSLVYGFPLVLMSPLTFLRRPESWLHAIHAYRGTLSGGPNFAFELCVRRIRDEDIQGLDLSSWRLAFNGAEPVSPATLSAFRDRFIPYGLKPEALTPVYGLAEATLGVAFTPVNRGPRIDRVRREAISHSGRAETAEKDDPETVEFVSSGVPIPGFEVRITDATGTEAREREEGALEFKGPSTTSGYYRNPEATKDLFHDDWLVSGDRGYIAEGEVYITGRTKDVVIRAGRNIYPYELEQAVADVAGVRRGCVAVFGATAPESGTERLVVVAETREQDESRQAEMREKIVALTQDLLGMPADEIVLAPPHTVLKTSSGKIRRVAIRDLYESGRLRPGGRAVWLQLTRLALASLAPSLRRVWRLIGALLFAAYALVLIGVATLVAWPLVVFSRAPEAAFRGVGRVARLVFGLAGVPLNVRGAENLPGGDAFVLVSNHASYLDGLVLCAVLPRPVGFVAKRELAGPAVTRLFLDKLGVHFVERFDKERSLEDARTVAGSLREGNPLGYFPEGTLHRMPGLLPFQLGAFAAAVDAGVAVVPVVIRGTRSILRGSSWFARRGRVQVEIFDPVRPAGDETTSTWEHAVHLRDIVRGQMLRHCGEPDLADRHPIYDLAEQLEQKNKPR
jgi:1-acyl-sn-glycerol-3-phosphate acyltransferase